MEQVKYLISEAAKKVEVESHVLRYWEEELELPIKRNELGHRYYTQEDVEHFREIKNLKEQGLQLKAIRMVLKKGESQEKHMIEIIGKRDIIENENESREEKNARLQMLLQHMIAEAVRENNRELCDDIKQSVLKEIDYQFRQQDEKEEERESNRLIREEEHYKKIDEMLRTYNKRGNRKDKKKEKGEKALRFGIKKKPSVV